VIDIHTHLLPGVDDGSPNAGHSALIMNRMREEGVRAIVCTPHLNASAAKSAPFDEHARLLVELQAQAPSDLTLYHGFEIMLDTDTVHLADARLGLAGSRARLVEFPRRGLPADATAQLARLRAQGLMPVVAHPERYAGCDTATIATWRELGAVIQCDAMALLARGPMADFALEMLGAGQVDILASDNHGDRRSLATAALWMTEIGAGTQASILTAANPQLLLAEQPLQPVPPVSFHRGVFDRLRELIFRSPLQARARDLPQ
jgi:protein-tyrosine phosphatase